MLSIAWRSRPMASWHYQEARTTPCAYGRSLRGKNCADSMWTPVTFGLSLFVRLANKYYRAMPMEPRGSGVLCGCGNYQSDGLCPSQNRIENVTPPNMRARATQRSVDDTDGEAASGRVLLFNGNLE